MAYEHQQNCKTEIEDIQDATNDAKKEVSQLENELEKVSDETETLEEKVEKLDAALEYENSVEDDLSESNTNLGRDLRNKNNEIKYYQCQLDLLMTQEKALKGGDKSKTVN